MEIVLAISKLYRGIKNAPEYVQRVDRQIRQLLVLVTVLQPQISLVKDPVHENNICVVLVDCYQDAAELFTLLEDLRGKEGDVSWKRGWNAFRGFNKQEKILQICTHLERHKSTLALWVATANQSSLTRVETSLDALNLSQASSVVEQINDMETKRLRKSYIHHKEDKQNMKPPRTSYSGVVCTCAAKRRTVVWNFGAGAQFRSSSIKHIADSCPCTDITERRFFVPSTFLGRAIHVSLATYSIDGRYSFAQSLICSRFVDDTTAPSFRLFTRYFEQDGSSQGQRRLLQGTTFDVRDTLENLQHCFRTGAASPHDINQYALQFFWALFQQGGLDYRHVAGIVRFLTESGVPPNEHGLSENTPASMISQLEENLMPRDEPFGDSKQLLLVKFFLSEGGDYEESDEFIQYRRGINLGCALFDPMPEFIEAANTSQATVAVMNKDLPKLEKIIKAGGDLDHVNSWGVGAVLYARNFPPALRMLLEAGADPHQVSKGGWNTLSGAVAWNNYEAVDILLEADTAVVGLEILFGILTLRKVDMQLKVLNALMNRRSRLRQFAQWHLVGEKWSHLDLKGPLALDQQAVLIVEALEDEGVPVPPSLDLYGQNGKKYNRRPEPLYALATMKSTTYHLQPLQINAHHLVTFFDSLLATGFQEFDIHNSDGMTPLLLCCSKGQWQAATWLLQKLERRPPQTMSNSSLNALHCFAQYLGEMYQTKSERLQPWMTNLVRDLSAAGVDVQQHIASGVSQSVGTTSMSTEPCYCCPGGQTPIVTLLKELAKAIRLEVRNHQVPLFNSPLFQSILKLWSEALPNPHTAMEDIYVGVVRQESFNRLGLTHTCMNLRGLSSGMLPNYHFDDEEVLRIRVEEEELYFQLEEIMSSCATARQSYEGTRVEFYRDWVLGLPESVENNGRNGNL